ncbi:MAG: NAD-dependent epimerase/dehydratase family protein [Anaerolineales bacterium]|nr:NAD-dependent epimerase/dehydratase family protein [Anaerolineales bacterium]
MNDKGHILVTGGAGYIGSFLTAELLRCGYQVTVLDSLLYGGESLLGFFHHPNFHFAKADVTEFAALRAALRRDWPTPEIPCPSGWDRRFPGLPGHRTPGGLET